MSPARAPGRHFRARTTRPHRRQTPPAHRLHFSRSTPFDSTESLLRNRRSIRRQLHAISRHHRQWTARARSIHQIACNRKPGRGSKYRHWRQIQKRLPRRRILRPRNQDRRLILVVLRRPPPLPPHSLRDRQLPPRNRKSFRRHRPTSIARALDGISSPLQYAQVPASYMSSEWT